MSRADALVEALRTTLPGRHALIDGACFDDLPALLAREGLQARALYLEGKDRATVAAGPFLLAVPGTREADVVTRIVGDLPAAVFWSYPGEGAALYDHLRRRTLVGIPRPGGRRTVLFRLADPDAVANVLGVLSPEQLAGFCGPEAAVLAPLPDGRVAFFAAHAGVAAVCARLDLDDAQAAAVDARFRRQLRQRAIRRFAPELPDARGAAEARIDDACARAEQYRLTSPDALWRFVALDVANGARFELASDCCEVREELLADGPSDMRLFLAEEALFHARAERERR